MFEKFNELKSRGKTIDLVSHALGSIVGIYDRTARIQNGELKALEPLQR
jgi:ABC-type multidrug transport system ATPase subunit